MNFKCGDEWETRIDSAIWNKKGGNKESEIEEEKDGKYELVR